MDQRIQGLEQRIRILEKKFNDIDGFLIHLSSLKIKERLDSMHRFFTYLQTWAPKVDERLDRVDEKLRTPPEHTEDTDNQLDRLDTTDEFYLNNLFGLQQSLEQIKNSEPKKTNPNKRHTGFQTRKIF